MEKLNDEDIEDLKDYKEAIEEYKKNPKKNVKVYDAEALDLMNDILDNGEL